MSRLFVYISTFPSQLTRRHAKVLVPLPAPRIQPERTEPLVDSHCDCGNIQGGENSDPELRREGQQEGK